MSHTYDIVCHDCRVRLWIGQGSDEKAYIYSTDKHLQKQRDFFFGHQRHRLEFGEDQLLGCEDYADLDPDTEEAPRVYPTKTPRGESPLDRMRRETEEKARNRRG